MVDYYSVGKQPIGLQVIALSEFGGEVSDRVGAALRVNGWVRVHVLMPKSAFTLGPEARGRFQAAVRELAKTFEFRDQGPVDIVFNPSSDGTTRQYDSPGEPVERR